MKIYDYYDWIRQPLKVLSLGAVLLAGGCSSPWIEPVQSNSGSGKVETMLAKTATAENQCVIGGKVERIVKVDMVALNQSFWYNRLGASQLYGMVYALASDVIVEESGKPLTESLDWKAGNYDKLVGKVTMRLDKRPRPIVLRANVHNCLQIQFTNLLEVAPQELTSYAGVHIQGTEVFSATSNNPNAIKSDGAFIGKNSNNLAAPGERKHYALFIPEEGNFILNSPADDFSNFLQGQLTFGLFGALNVQPKYAEYYRSQVSEADLSAATTGQDPVTMHPIIDYQATYSAGVYKDKPILNMLKAVAGEANTWELVHTDQTAIITGPNAGRFPAESFPVYGDGKQYPNGSYQPDNSANNAKQRAQPYREFNIMYHEPVKASQAFTQFVSGDAANTFAAGGDFFAINYGMAGIGPEILSNRLGVGPMYDCATCAYEEFFLSSWTVGDPAMIVDVPANFCDDTQPNPVTDPTSFDAINGNNPPPCEPTAGPKATKAFYPDDPSNVYHSYMNDHLKMRIHHGAGTLHHLHHLHAHQWLHTPNSDSSHYLDSQLIGPGSSFTLDMVYNGSGNRNQTVGDSIFHCHFYPHFAEGMWGMWRVHDVFEAGTKMVDGKPAAGSRALPDAEIAQGTPIPGLVPLPTLAMAPMPGEVAIVNGQIVLPEITVDANNVGRYKDSGEIYHSPGYPFFIPGIAGERAPHPPMDFAASGSTTLDGGLPRHIVYPFNSIDSANYPPYDPDIVEYHNKFDFSKFVHVLRGTTLPEDGTAIEKVAMGAHAQRAHASSTPSGDDMFFVLNGLAPQQGAPFADPCSNNGGDLGVLDRPNTDNIYTRQYRGVDMQMDVVLNKKGWHYPQQRFGVLWEDLIPTLRKERPAEPLFFRANSNDCIDYWFSNVVPEYYELDDFQVRTPTDILGQHIHLVKFDVTSSDGGANGWNYEDGTFSPETVRERLKGFKKGQLDNYSGNYEPVAPYWLCEGLSTVVTTGGISDMQMCRDNAENEWRGAQTTVQRWFADPQLNYQDEDRTLRTVFTHDHFGPSTHQQAGLYMGLLIEPEGSVWKNSETGVVMGTRADGGPTSWQAIIEPGDAGGFESYREFMLEFQDFQLAYTKDGLTPQDCGDYTGDLAPMCYPLKNKEQATKYDKNDSDYAALNKLCLMERVNNAQNQACSNRDKAGNKAGYVSALRSFTNNYSGYILPGAAINPPQGQSGQVNTPTLISTTPPFALGTYSVNYRNEPLPFRVWDPTPDANGKQQQSTQPNGDLAYVYNSIERADPDLNSITPVGSPDQPPLTSGVYKYDPYTPLMRAYQGDKVQIRTLVGAHINMHNFSMQGLRWLFEPDYKDSGYRSNQPMGISEHFEMNFQLPISSVNGDESLAPAGAPSKADGCTVLNSDYVKFADYMYNPSSEENGLLNGNWGLIRAYQPDATDTCITRLPDKPAPTVAPVEPQTCPNQGEYNRIYNVVAVTASQLPVVGSDPQGQLYYSFRENIADPNALLYFGCDPSVDAQCSHDQLMQDLPSQSAYQHIEPFVLRAAAGECVTVNLNNRFKTSGNSFPGAVAVSAPDAQNALLQFRYNSSKDTGDNCTKYYTSQYQCDMKLAPSKQVAMAPQLVSYDINNSNGINLGFNDNQSVPLGEVRQYTWYAGITHDDANGVRTYTPAEFGSANLLTADPIKQTRYGMLAGMVIEPEGACWSSQDGSKTSCKNGEDSNGTLVDMSLPKSSSLTGVHATVYVPSDAGTSYFRENVIMFQDQLAFSRFTNTVNYGVERMAGRDTGLTSPQGQGRYTFTVPFDPHQNQPESFVLDMACSYSSSLGSPYGDPDLFPPTGIAMGDPETTIFHANPGDQVRFRVMEPHGADQHVFELFGHVWQEEPYSNDSTVIADNPKSQWQGSRMGVSAKDRFDVVLGSAGGAGASPGDYLYRSYPGGDQNYGMWGLFRVGDPANAYDNSNRPLVCVPQYIPNSNDSQYIYDPRKIYPSYSLPANCNLVVSPTGGPSAVNCS